MYCIIVRLKRKVDRSHIISEIHPSLEDLNGVVKRYETSMHEHNVLQCGLRPVGISSRYIGVVIRMSGVSST
jgi:hypothetical protein